MESYMSYSAIAHTNKIKELKLTKPTFSPWQELQKL
jgi:hypothetical protein